MKPKILTWLGWTLLVLMIGLTRGQVPTARAAGQCGNSVGYLPEVIEVSNASTFQCYLFDVSSNTSYLVLKVEPLTSPVSLDLYHTEGKKDTLDEDDLVNSPDARIQGDATYVFLQPDSGVHTVAVAGASPGTRLRLSVTTTSPSSAASNQVSAQTGEGQRVMMSVVFSGGLQIGSKYGDRIIFPIEVGKAGVIQARATWNGSAKNLSLILNGPGKTNVYARVNGASPLTLTYTVSASDASKGHKWLVSLVNFGGGTARGDVSINYPGTDIRVVRVSPRAIAVLPELLRDTNLKMWEAVKPAVCGGEIINKQVVAASIPAVGRACSYNFSGSTGERVTIRMTRANIELDPWLELFDPAGNRVAVDDDGGGGRNSLITYTLGGAGKYRVVAGAYRGASAGGFELSFNQLPPLPPTPTPTPVPPTPPPLADCPDPNVRWENVVDGQTLPPYARFIGTATADDFLRYVVEFDRPGNILYYSMTPVVHGKIFDWDTYTVENGYHLVVLTVTRRDGTMLPSCFVRVIVAR